MSLLEQLCDEKELEEYQDSIDNELIPCPGPLCKGKLKPKSAFRKVHKSYVDASMKRHRNKCRECERHEGKILRELKKLHKPENGICKICETDVGIENLVLDHDHDTMKFRGFICDTCNRAVAYLGDTYEEVMRAANYLKEANKRNETTIS